MSTTLPSPPEAVDIDARVHAVLEEIPSCDHCGERDAVCRGRYEDNGSDEDEDACDECCGHGNEDGHCEPVPMPRDVPATLRAVLAELTRLRSELAEARGETGRLKGALHGACDTIGTFAGMLAGWGYPNIAEDARLKAARLRTLAGAR